MPPRLRHRLVRQGPRRDFHHGLLRAEWVEHLHGLTEDERVRVRQRSLRLLAVETGIIERLYEIDWGLTLTLVAEGFARDVVERANGKIDDRTLATLRAQRDSLELVVDFVRAQRDLGPGFIKELHHAITRTQETYEVIDALNRVASRKLIHGDWKKEPNHVLRPDGSVLEYAPPEQVASEVEHLIQLYREIEGTNAHPIVKCAWFHHRFVQIHPFADGNGRVARALTLLVLEKNQYAPLVVDRRHRSDYISALDAANEGNLSKIIQLFTRLEGAALTRELERPEPVAAGMSLDVAHTLADQLAALQQQRDLEARARLRTSAMMVAEWIRTWFDRKAAELTQVFRVRGLKKVEVLSFTEMPPNSARARWFAAQVIDSARAAGHYADFDVFSGWANLRIRVEGFQLRYVASLHGAGRDGRVMAITTFGHIKPFAEASEPDELAGKAEDIDTTKDAFRFVHTETAEQVAQRRSELYELLDDGLAEALAQLLKRV